MNENKPQGNIEWLKQYNLALTDDVPCDSITCNEKATLYSQIKCCGTVVFGCTNCMNATYHFVLHRMKEMKPIKCMACSKTNMPFGWISRPRKIELDSAE